MEEVNWSSPTESPASRASTIKIYRSVAMKEDLALHTSSKVNPTVSNGNYAIAGIDQNDEACIVVMPPLHASKVATAIKEASSPDNMISIFIDSPNRITASPQCHKNCDSEVETMRVAMENYLVRLERGAVEYVKAPGGETIDWISELVRKLTSNGCVGNSCTLTGEDSRELNATATTIDGRSVRVDLTYDYVDVRLQNKQIQMEIPIRTFNIIRGILERASVRKPNKVEVEMSRWYAQFLDDLENGKKLLL